MKYFSVVYLVIIGVLVAKTESKDFCEAFKDNGFKIDYSFEHIIYMNKTKKGLVSTPALIIGHDYWLLLEDFSNFSVKLESTESRFSDVFGNHYITAFSVRKGKNDGFIHGFIRKNDKTIEWKALKDLRNIASEANTTVETSDPSFPPDFEPSVSFCHPFKSYVNKQVFVDQKQESNKSDAFQRTYTSKRLNKQMKIIAINNSDYEVADSSQGRGLVVRVSGIHSNKSSVYLVFYTTNQTIEYCFQDSGNQSPLFVDQPCPTERKALINCSQKKASWLLLWHLVTIVLAIVAASLIIMLCVLCFTKSRKIRALFSSRKPNDEIPSDSSDQKRDTTNSNLKTGGSETGISTKSKSNLSNARSSIITSKVDLELSKERGETPPVPNKSKRVSQKVQK